MERVLRRRDVLKTAAVAASGYWVAGSTSRAESRSPSEKLNIGIIGVANRGAANLAGVSGENIVALCDIDEKNLGQAAAKYPQARTYRDWRKLLETDKTVEAVVISTTDHTHAPAAVMAMRLGKHVYCEKPLAHSVHEARVVGETYRKSKVATQMGTQVHATDNYRRVVELVQSGAIGPVREAHVWCGRVSGEGKRPADSPPVPAHIDWDLWLGPAPARAYHSIYMPGNLVWNRWWDFGNGTLGDMGSHLIDLPYWALELRHPTSVESEGPAVDKEINPAWMIVRWQHPARGKHPAVKLAWYHGGKRPDAPEGIDLAKWFNGILFIGDAGMLLADYNRRVLLPEKKFKDFEPPKPTIAKSRGHYEEWIHAAKTGEPTTGEPTLCNFNYSGALVENNLLGNVAFRVGKKLEWNAEKLTATNCPEADEFIRREYRKGWGL